MCLYFVSKTNFELNDLRIIEQAVLDHSTGKNIQSTVGAALMIADKLTDANRANHLKADLIRGGFNDESELNKLNKYINPSVNKYFIQLNIKGGDLIFSYNVESNTEDFINEYLAEKLKSTPFILTQNAADYLKCNCIYKVNGDEVKF
jgi:HD superfamily phosphohydrolase YqeK